MSCQKSFKEESPSRAKLPSNAVDFTEAADAQAKDTKINLIVM